MRYLILEPILVVFVEAGGLRACSTALSEVCKTCNRVPTEEAYSGSCSGSTEGLLTIAEVSNVLGKQKHHCSTVVTGLEEHCNKTYKSRA